MRFGGQDSLSKIVLDLIRHGFRPPKLFLCCDFFVFYQSFHFIVIAILRILVTKTKTKLTKTNLSGVGGKVGNEGEEKLAPRTGMGREGGNGR